MQAGFWYGGTQVHSDSATAGDVITTFWACLLASKCLEDILPQMVVLGHGRVAASSLMAVLSKVTEAKTQSRKTDGLSPKFCEGAVEVRDVSRLSAICHWRKLSESRKRRPLPILSGQIIMYLQNAASSSQRDKPLSLLGKVVLAKAHSAA